ncbi:MAG: hypothetical protein QXI37_03140, partial [Thermoprotei archaeon]
MDEVLKNLLNADGPPGFESGVADVLEPYLKKSVSKVRRDGIGNLVATKEGSSGKSIALLAHMDEVSFMVQHVSPDGFVKVVELGGWDNRILPGMEVKILSQEPVYGVFATKPPHITSESERNQVLKLEDMSVDTGLSAQELAAKGVETGTPIVPASEIRFNGETVSSKALDDRVGCYILTRLADLLSSTRHTIHYVGTVQEELGVRGARVVSNYLNVSEALVLEATVAADQPGVPEDRRPSGMGRGAVITVMDKSMVANPSVYRALRNTAGEHGIPYQIKKPAFGGT